MRTLLGPRQLRHESKHICNVFIFFWDLSWAGLMFMVAAEVLPLPIRGIGLGLVATVYWSGSFLWAFYLQELFEAVGTSTTFFMLSATTCGSISSSSPSGCVQPSVRSLQSLRSP